MLTAWPADVSGPNIAERSSRVNTAQQATEHLNTRTDRLFEPFEAGSLQLRYRIVMAPMTRNFSPQGVPGDNVAAYYRRRAEGGVGLIVTEGAWVPHPSAANDANVPDFHGAAALAGWANVVAEVHAAGAKIMPQLWHVGLIRKQPTRDQPGGHAARADQIGPSGITGGFGHPLQQVSEPMSLNDIDAVIESFAVAAASACSLGFDGVALHGAHGYLIDQFLWHATNQRTDKYGGSHRARATFAAEIVTEIKRRTRADFPVIFRFSQWKSQDYNARIADKPGDLEALLGPLVDAGVDLFDCSQRRFWEPAFAGSGRTLAGWTRKLTDCPTIAVGSVGLDVDFMTSLFVRGTRANAVGLEGLLDRMDEGEFDLVGVGRALLADPEWANKIKSGHAEAIVPFTPQVLGALC